MACEITFPLAEELLSKNKFYNTLASKFDTQADLLACLGRIFKLDVKEISKNKTTVTKIISGGQTGVDTIGLQVAKSLGIETGGTAPKGYLREQGVDNEDIKSYGLVEITPEEQADYTKRKGKQDPYTGRTELNVRNSDGTVYFSSEEDSAGRIATKRAADEWNKPFIENPTSEQLKEFINNNNIKILNVAGNRGTKLKNSNQISTILQNALIEEIEQVSDISINFSPQFREWYKEHYNKSLPTLNKITSSSIDELVSSALEYNSKGAEDGNATAKVNDSYILSTEYTNGNSTRLQGIKIAQGFVFDSYFDLKYRLNHEQIKQLYGTRKLSSLTKENYQTEVIVKYMDALVDAINKTSNDNKLNLNTIHEKYITEDILNENYNKFKEFGIDEDNAIGLANVQAELNAIEPFVNKQKASPYVLNIIAALHDMLNFNVENINGKHTRVRDDYFKKVWCNSLLSQLNIKDELDYVDQIELQEEDERDNDIQIDTSFRDYENRLGSDYSSYKLHIGKDINMYLNHLDDIDYSEHNDFGLPSKMDSSKVASLLYSSVDRRSLDAMIESIRVLSEKIPGFKGLQILYNDLKANKDLAAKFYVSFAKYKMPSFAITVDGMNINVKTNEHQLSKESVLRFSYYSDARNTAIYNNLSLLGQKKFDVKNAIDEFRKNRDKSHKEEAVIKLTSLIKEYIPTIDYANIYNFVSKSGMDELQAIQTINGLLDELILNIENRKNYIDSQASDYIMNNEVLTKNITGVLNQFVNYLLPYSNPFVQLTVSNVLGKNHSALENNTFLTRFMDMLNSDLNDYKNGKVGPLLEHGRYLINNTKQFNYSSILLEQSDENGIINPGLFKYDGEELVYTPYVKDLIKIIDFDGIKDVFGEGATYVKTSEVDYLLSTFNSFFEGRDDKVDFILAPYLLKTPSDSSHNKGMYAPVHRITSTDELHPEYSLYKYNKDIVKQQTGDLFKKIKFGKYEKRSVSKGAVEITYDKFMDTLKQDSFKVFAINEKAIKRPSQTEHYITFQVDDEGTKYTVVVEGKYDTENKIFTRNKENYLTIVKEDEENLLDLANRVKELITNDIINRRHITIGGNTWYDGQFLTKTINKNHAIYKQMRNAFLQEAQNAGTAIKFMFDTANGSIAPSNLITDKKSKFYKNYHYKKTKDENGNEIEEPIINGKLTGQVFTSDRFTLTDDKGNLVNYMTKKFEVDGKVYQVINDDVIDISKPNATFNPYSINFLYGGADSYLHLDSEGNAKLTAKQEEALDYALEQYILDYVKDSKKRLLPYTDLIHSASMTSDDNVAEYALNYHMMYINSCDLFDGDSKFYKDTQDIFKRLKETQAGGLSYAIYDVAKPKIKDSAEKQLIEGAYLNSNEIQNKLKKYGISYSLNDCKQYNSFVGVTITNKKVTNVKDNKIIGNKLAEALRMSKDLTEDQIKEKVAKTMSGYTDITTDDAQSYITLEEWIRRLAARGQLNENMPLIQKLLDKNAPLTDKDLDTFVQVQKNFYYDLHLDEDAGIIVPRQIKNAEYVLVPRFIEGTQLQTLYDNMIEAGIDQLNTEETSKAGKSKIVDVWTKDKTGIRKNLVEAFGENKQQYDYNYLYTQQETPQHMDESNKAGVQIVKKLIDNIQDITPEYKETDEWKNLSDEVKQNKIKLYNDKQKFLDNFSENIKASFTDLMQDLIKDVKSNMKNGNLVIDGEVVKGVDYMNLLERLESELLRLNADSNSLDYVTLIDDAFETVSKDENSLGIITKMPTIFPSIKTKLEHAAQAIFNNNITKQLLPGFHAAQVTSAGFASLNSENPKYIKSKKLNYHISEDGFVNYIEVLVPASAFGLSLDDSKYKNGEEMRQALQDAGLDQFIGYRIPTEGKQSVCIMKVVGILDNSQGSTIVVPDGWVAQTGSDFDIDSIYTILYESIVDREGDIHKYHSEENNKSQRNNNIVDALLSILNNPLTLEEGLSQSKTTDITDELKDLVKGSYIDNERRNRSSFNVLDQIEFQTEGLQGKDLKAFSVNRDGFNSICNVAKPTLNKPIKVVYTLNENQYKLAIKTFGKDNVEDLDGQGHYEVTHTTWGWTNTFRNIKGDLLLPYSSETTAHMLDAVKIGHIPNVNTETFKVYKTFVDIGSDYSTALVFIMQPAIGRFIDKYNRKKSIYSEDLTDPMKQTYVDIAKQLGVETKQKNKKEIKQGIAAVLADEIETIYNILDYDILKERFYNNSPVSEESAKDLAIDYLILDKYEELSDIASEAENYSMVLRPDKFGAKESIWKTKKVFKDIYNILDKEKHLFTVNDKNLLEAIYPGIDNGFNSYLQDTKDDESVYKPLQYFLKYGTATSIAINKLLFPTESVEFENFVESLSDYLTVRNLPEDVYKSFTNYILQGIYNNIKSISFPVDYIKNKGFKSRNVKSTEDRLKVQEAEKQRIFGYQHIFNTRNNPSNFKVVDIARPTQEEINQFSNFSPAEKVKWVKDNFADSLICKYLEPRTYINSVYGEKYQACQTISFNEDNIGSEVVYDEFDKTFNNTNPFLAMTALDLIKYAFVVEGYQTRKHSINRVIKNSVLINDNNNYGLNIIEDLKNEFNKFVTNLKDTETRDLIREDFIRSHTELESVPKLRLNKDNYKDFIKNNNVQNTSVIKLSLEQAEVINEDTQNNKEDEQYQNFLNKLKPYIIIQGYEGGKLKSILYKTVNEYDNVIYLYPLSKLQNNETGDISWYDENNKLDDNVYQPQNYYLEVIEKDYNGDSNLPKIQRNLTTFDNNAVILNSKEEELGDIKKLKNTIVDNENNYFVYKANDVDYLNKKLPYVKEKYIPLKVNNKNYRVERFIMSKGLFYFTTQEGLKDLYNSAKRKYDYSQKSNNPISKEDALRKTMNQYVAYSRLSKELQNVIFDKVNLWINTHANNNFNNFNAPKNLFGNLFIVQKVEVKQTSVEESLTYATKQNIKYARTSRNPLAEKFSKGIKQAGVNIHENDLNSSDDEKIKNTIGNHLEDIASLNRIFVKNEVKDIEDRLNTFTEINGTWRKINDSDVMKALKDDPELHTKYLTLLLDAHRLIRAYTNDTFDFRKITGNNNTFVKENIAQINEDIARLNSSDLLNEAEKSYVEEYLTKLSNNPAIRNGVTSLLDSYHATSWFTSQIADFQDTHNPALQVIQTTVMQNIRGADLQAEHEIEIFHKTWEDIVNRAKAAGRPINMKHIIDETGRRIRDYNSEFEADLKMFDKTIAALQLEYEKWDEIYTKNPTSENKFARYNAHKNYLDKQLEFDKFKLKNINQVIKDEYIQKEIQLNEYMLNNYPDIFVEYDILKTERNKLYNIVNVNVPDENSIRLEEVEKAIANLTNYWDKAARQEKEEIPFETQPKKTNNIKTHEDNIELVSSADALIGYISHLKEWNETVYTREEKENFRENLDKNLQIIAEAESPQQATDGHWYIPSQKVLMDSNENYRNAKLWLYRNATFYFGSLYDNKEYTKKDFIAKLNEVYDKGLKMDFREQLEADPNISEENKQKLIDEYNLRIRSAISYFRNYDIKGFDVTPPRFYKELAKTRNAYDEYGVIDGTKFTETDIDNIKDSELRRLQREKSSILSEKSIIHFNPKAEDNTIYNKDFYAGMTLPGAVNEDYERVVKSINSFLIHGINEEGIFDASLLSLDDLKGVLSILQTYFGYDPVEQEFDYRKAVKKYLDKDIIEHLNLTEDELDERREQIKKFIEDNVDFERNQDEFEAAKARISDRSEEYKILWNKVFAEYDENNHNYNLASHLFFGYAKPKDSVKEQFVDKQKTSALRILDKAFDIQYTKYYYDARREASNKGQKYFRKWFEKNHIYNAYKHRFEPLAIWTTTKTITDVLPGEWRPTYNQQNSVISEKAYNSYYKKDLSRESNFKTKERNKEIKSNYKNAYINNPPIIFNDIDVFTKKKDFFDKSNLIPPVNYFTTEEKYYNKGFELTPEEQELKDYIDKTLTYYSRNKKSNRYINDGWMPARAKTNSKSITDPSLWLNELIKGLGFITGYQGNEDWQKYVEYDTDYIPDMPMLHRLKSVDSTKESEIPAIPERKDGESIEDYNKRVEDYRKLREEQEANDLKIHQDLLDNNWEDVIAEFIKKATHYNAVQENKLMLYFGQELLENYGTYEEERKQKGFGKYSGRRNGTYHKVQDTKLQEQYANWIRRIVFDQFKKPQGWRTKALQMMQSLTSTQYMTLNIRAGVSNITVGESNIVAEAFAREYFDTKTYLRGKTIYMTGIGDYFSHLYDDYASTKVGAIIKTMNIIDFTELTGQVRELSAEEFSRRLRDAGFSPLSMGEHYMQNSAMLSMMLSHRIIIDADGDYRIMNENEFNEEVANIVFNEMATEEEKAKYNADLEEIKNDPNKAKDYAQFRRNLVTDSVKKFDKERKKEFGKRTKDLIKSRKEKFESNPTVWDNLDRGNNGRMIFAEGSILKTLNDKYFEDKAKGTTKFTTSPAYLLMGRFQGRIIDVNKKIHGWYDKYSAAKIESGLFGGLLMQYHKHLYPGILKRYRPEAYYNESRGTVEKGYYVSLIDFLKLNIENVKQDPKYTNEQKSLLEGLQNIIGFIVDFIGYWNITKNMLPEYEQANLRRNWGDLAGMAVAVCLALVACYGFDDDDDDAFMPNFILYQADRLASETFMWNPIGAMPEFKKLYANPIAFSSNLSDGMETLEVICGMLFGGEDYNPRFTTGRYAGRNKLGVYAERRIPYWRNIRSIMDISINNRYYKLGGNILSLIPLDNDKIK